MSIFLSFQNILIVLRCIVESLWAEVFGSNGVKHHINSDYSLFFLNLINHDDFDTSGRQSSAWPLRAQAACASYGAVGGTALCSHLPAQSDYVCTDQISLL